ncbi:MAG: glycerol-3-phosphate dehydrogenase [Firmicutes bacterium]|nr:glycerol-3-phosphate dehydrogenase [Bacillota bacterium]
MRTITIVGAGMMGSAMCTPAHDNGHIVRLVGTPLDREIIASVKQSRFHPTLQRHLPTGVQAYQIEELEQALDGAELVIGGVSSFGVDWFSEQVLPLIPTHLPVLLVTKGLAAESDGELIPFPHYMQRKVGLGKRLSLNAVGGPCTSYELADRRPSVVCFCGEDASTLARLKEMLETDYYHISISTDVVGVEAAVALKNAYALGVSLAIGLIEREEGIGCREAYNPQAALFGQAMREMASLVGLVGGKEESLAFGIADLYVTIFGGRTRRLGTLLGRGLSFQDAMTELEGITLESVAIATAVAKAMRIQEEKGAIKMTDFPLLKHVDEIINQGKHVSIPWKEFTHQFL